MKAILGKIALGCLIGAGIIVVTDIVATTAEQARRMDKSDSEFRRLYEAFKIEKDEESKIDLAKDALSHWGNMSLTARSCWKKRYEEMRAYLHL